MSGHRDSTCQKHELPKSLQGTEDAEIVWGMITERFPNAAPLLCEMEAVIDRAEDLLQQLKTPCREIETSTSFCTQDSEESTLMISARGSLTTENEILEEVEMTSRTVGVSETTIYEQESDTNEQNKGLLSKEQVTENLFSDSTVIHPPVMKKYSSDESASINVETMSTHSSYFNGIEMMFRNNSVVIHSDIDETAKEARSLEGWGKIVDDAMQGIIGIRNKLKSIRLIEEVYILIVTSKGDQHIKKPEKSIVKHVPHEETKTRRHKANGNLYSLSMQYKCLTLNYEFRKESCIILHRQESSDIGDSEVENDFDGNARSHKLIEMKQEPVHLSFQGSGDKSAPRKETPLCILEAYANRCNVSVEYENITDGPHRHKSNVYVIRGNLAGFAVTCRGLTEESTKNDLAAKILQMIANRQMKDEKLGQLAELTRDEMMKIINFDTDDLKDTAQKKLYQLCLEKEQQVPKYYISKLKTYQGFTYNATCYALGYSTEGCGVRECVAKKAAADELYQKYCEGQKPTLKVRIDNAFIDSV
ncbi:LOW QUALITY PROTEIN: uncharacterized protein LOC108623977 [Ceratina calcarata]|uniref:LOW QUALITY PROTEIN: uncharacterized protein LOC108623977 n=1 Tax=Ceratina calcarata TaxID=156304 RepID=A0AAJ7S0B3_9HYME|nr:LOW QUALITY PROTEIN: uncharacterized protein LOC108623977 [Ceratina calcarata]